MWLLIIFVFFLSSCQSVARYASNAPSSKSEQVAPKSRTVNFPESQSAQKSKVTAPSAPITTPKTKTNSSNKTISGPAPRYEAEGRASYYAHKFHGRKTSSGEVYDMHKLTAAHRTLPFGTQLKVTNLSNNKSVVVRVNDRGPFKKERLIDVSLEAAKRLEMIGPGVIKVRIETLN